MQLAVDQTKQALCRYSKCGAVVIKDGEPIGRGYNAPPRNSEDHRGSCRAELVSDKMVHDCAHCVHAEWRAISDALRNNPDKVEGSTLFFVRLDEEGNILKSEAPHCTVCSRLALDSGIAGFALWQEDGIRSYPTGEFNRWSKEHFN